MSIESANKYLKLSSSDDLKTPLISKESRGEKSEADLLVKATHVSPVSKNSASQSSPSSDTPKVSDNFSALITKRRKVQTDLANADNISINFSSDDDKSVMDTLAQYNNARLQKLWKISLAVSLFDIIYFIPLVLFLYNWDIDKCFHEEIQQYAISNSVGDAYALNFLRNFLILLFLCSHYSFLNYKASFFYTICYWVSFFSVVLVICKLLIYSQWKDVYRSLILASQLITSLIAFLIFRKLAPPSDDDWDIILVEEKEAKQKRSLASKNADERADILREKYRKAGNLEALQRFEEIEIKRKKAEENYERETQMKMFKQQKTQRVPFSEFFLLLKPYFWPSGIFNRFIVFFTWTLLILSKVSSIISPLYIGLATSSLVNGEGIPYFYLSMYCGLQFATVLFKQSQNTIYLRVKQQAFIQVAEFAFYHLHTLSHNWHLQKKMGVVLRAMDRGISSADNVVTYIFLFLLPAIAECITVFIIFFLKFKMPGLSAIVLFFLSLYVAVTIQITIARKKHRKATNRHDNAFHDKANDSLTNFESVKFFCNEKHETDRYVESVKTYQEHSIATQVSLAALNTLQTFCIQGCLLSCLLLTGTSVYHGELDIGSFTTVHAYVLSLFTPLSFLGSIYDFVLQSFVDMNNLAELLSEEPEVEDLPNAVPLILENSKNGATVEFKSVSFHYPSQNEEAGLHDISFKVPAGTTTAIVGTTGSGKSTLGRLLFRFYNVLGGSIEIDGQNIQNVTLKSLRSSIGVVPQDTALFNDTLLYNVLYGNLDATMDQIEDACDKAQILDFILSLPNQWQTTAGERGLRLSGGEKQRIAIARALLKDPPIVLLDEATSALDTVKEREIQKSLRTLGKNRTTIVIAHRLSTIKHAEQIIVLEFGRIIERGTHDELLSLGGKYRELWMEQVTSTTNPDLGEFNTDVDDNMQELMSPVD